jgi:hypothetical protein
MATVIKLKITVEELDNILSQFNRIKIYRSTTGVDGVYSEITTVATTIRLEQGIDEYEYDDQAGDISYWYKSTFYHTDTTLESNQSEPIKGADTTTDGILSKQELLDYYLFGLDLTDDEGNPFPDGMYDWGIRFAIDWIEKELDIKVRPTQITERYDYWRRDYQEYVFMKLRQGPVIDDLQGATLPDPTLTTVKVMWPSNVEVLEFDQSWIQIREDIGHINIIPATGTLSQVLLTAGGAFLPLIASGRDFVPNLYEIQYTAGFRTGEVPMDIRELIGKKAAFAPLNVAGDLLGGAGIASQSIGVDSLSQSFSTTSSATNAGYGARLLQYEREIKEQLPTLRRYYKGIRLTVV